MVRSSGRRARHGFGVDATKEAVIQGVVTRDGEPVSPPPT